MFAMLLCLFSLIHHPATVLYFFSAFCFFWVEVCRLFMFVCIVSSTFCDYICFSAFCNFSLWKLNVRSCGTPHSFASFFSSFWNPYYIIYVLGIVLLGTCSCESFCMAWCIPLFLYNFQHDIKFHNWCHSIQFYCFCITIVPCM